MRFSLYFNDIRTWIVLFFLIRLIGITNAPLEVAHNWRQSAANTVARNFQEIDANIFYPRFDTAGTDAGISGTEFPLFNYLIFIFNLLFGYSHWYGRLINLIVSSIGTYFFYRIIASWWSRKVAFYAALVLLTSLWFTYSRKIMPDTFSISFCLIGLHFGLMYFKRQKPSDLMCYVLFSTLGILAKIPAATVLSILALPMLSRRFESKLKLRFLLASAVPLALAGWWYFYWFDHITTSYQLFRMGPGIQKGFFQLLEMPIETLNNFYFDALKFSGFILFLVGLVLAIVKRAKQMLWVLSIAGLAFFVFMMQAGYGFRIHEYYTLPFVPVMALFAGYAIASMEQPKWRYLFIGIVMIEGIANQQHDFFIKPHHRYKLALEDWLDQNNVPPERVVVNGGRNPQLMYFAHRRGWSVASSKLRDTDLLNSLIQDGAAYLVWDKHYAPLPAFGCTTLADSPDFAIIDLRNCQLE